MQTKSNIAAFFDFDETLIDVNTSKVGFRWLYDNKLLTNSYLLKVMIFNFLYKIKLLSEKQMADSLMSFYKNKKLSYFEEHADSFYQDLIKHHFAPNILAQLEHHKKKDHIIVIVSGSIRYYLEPVAKDIGIDHLICTDLEIGDDGLLTGKPIGQICIGQYKKELTLKLVEELNIDLKQSFAYGNDGIDIPFMELVGNPIAVEPSPKLRKVALNKNWSILKYR